MVTSCIKAQSMEEYSKGENLATFVEMEYKQCCTVTKKAVGNAVKMLKMLQPLQKLLGQQKRFGYTLLGLLVEQGNQDDKCFCLHY